MTARELLDKQKTEIAEGKRQRISCIEIRFDLVNEFKRVSCLLEKEQSETEKIKAELRRLSLEIWRIDRILF